MKTITLLALAVWALMVFLAILNAVLREAVYGPVLDNELRAHQVSSVTLVLMFLLVTYLFLRWTDAEYNERDLVVIGLLWVAMTVSFEFLFGHFVMGNPWERMLHDYNLLEGKVWLLVLVALAVMPWLVGKYLVGGVALAGPSLAQSHKTSTRQG